MSKPEIVIDFETYFDSAYSLKKLGIIEYIGDARFKIHGFGIRHADARKVLRVDPERALRELQQQYGPRLEGAIIVVHKGAFDLSILKMKFNISPANFLDTMWLAYQINGRKDGGDGESASLEALALKHDLKIKKGDLDFMSGVVELTAEQWMKLEAYTFNDLEITYEILQLYKPKITRPAIEIPLMLHTMRLFTERGIKVDTVGLVTLRGEITQEIEKLLASADVTMKFINSNKKFAERLSMELARTGRVLPTKPGRNGEIPACAKTDEAMQSYENDHDPVVKVLAQARLGVRSLITHIARLVLMEKMVAIAAGDLKIQLAYYGARTGRFAGADGWNIQNIAKKGIGAKIRRLLIPHDDCVFITVDLSQIEARVIAWIAGQTDLLQQFSNYDLDKSKDVYCQFASQTFRCSVRPVRDDDSPETKEQLVAYRQLGKRAVLGLGFGMGALTFMIQLRQDPMLVPLFDQGILTPQIFHEIVRSYRSTYSKILGLWRGLEGAVVDAINGQRRELNGMIFWVEGTTLNLQLPSGRVLHYPDIRLVDHQGTRQFLNEWGDVDEFECSGPAIVYGANIPFYGGKIAENVVQATARDLFVESMLRLERLDLKVLWHTHDESVFEVPKLNAEAALADVKREMRTPPAWATGLPLACDARLAEQYGK
ncbi:MAG: DNA polymerase [Planctomycetota bacterium]